MGFDKGFCNFLRHNSFEINSFRYDEARHLKHSCNWNINSLAIVNNSLDDDRRGHPVYPPKIQNILKSIYKRNYEDANYKKRRGI